MSSDLKQRTMAGLLWTAIEQGGGQVLQLVSGIILARLLFPADYGLFGMIVVFLAVAQAVSDFGMTQAVIRKRDLTPLDLSTAFWFNLALGLGLYAVLYLAAPAMARFYRHPQVTDLARVVGWVLPINAIGMTASAGLSRQLRFRAAMTAHLGSAALAAAAGIGLALAGWGAWSLVAQALVQSIAATVMLRWLSAVPVRAVFSTRSLRDLTGFGGPLLVAGLIYRLGDQAAAFAIGRRYVPADLGFFTKARRLALLPETLLYGVVYKVLYPAFCQLAADRERLGYHYRVTQRILAAATSAVMLWLAAVAPVLVPWLLTDRWAASVPLLQRLCVAGIVTPLTNLNLNLMKVIGRPRRVVCLEAMRQGCVLTALLVALPLGIVALTEALALAAMAAFLGVTWANQRLTGCRLRIQVVDLLSGLLPAAVATAGTAWMRRYGIFTTIGIIDLLGASAVWILVYLGLIGVTRPRALRDVLGMVRDLRAERRRQRCEEGRS